MISATQLIGAMLFAALLFIACVCWGWKLRHGKWLSSIAGNNFATKEERLQPQQLELGKAVGVIMYLMGGLIVLIALVVLSNYYKLFALQNFALCGCAIIVVSAMVRLVWFHRKKKGM